MLVANPKISRLAAVGRFYVPLSQTQQNELVTAITTTDKADALPSWISDYFAQVEQLFEEDKASVAKHMAGKHDQSSHGKGGTGKAFTKEEYPEFEQSIISYTDGSGTYSIVNEFLRNGEQSWMSPNEIERVKVVASDLRSAIDKSPKLQSATKVYRGLDADAAPLFDNLQVGQVIQDKGFMSTSRSKTVASGFQGDDGFLMQISIPAGKRALNPLAYRMADGAEAELILQAETSLRFTGSQGNTFKFEVADE